MSSKPSFLSVLKFHTKGILFTSIVPSGQSIHRLHVSFGRGRFFHRWGLSRSSCTLTGRRGLIRPIAGTRQRKNHQRGHLLEQELLADEKEKAEHLMLVDLARNDIGRVCEIGSVHAAEYMTIERYSHVMHIVSRVVGKLSPKKMPLT